MKRLFPALLLFSIIIYFSSCEKDDICVEGDTPLLVIGFYDVTDSTFKNVSNLRINALDNDSVLNSSSEFGFSDRGNSPDSVLLPLRINANSTRFEFILGSEDDTNGNETGNIDTIQFNYSVVGKFVSRACGFVANYNELNAIREVSSQDWIQGVHILDTNIKQSNTIHVQIFH